MRFFGLKTCDTCRKALKALHAAGHEPEVIDVRADGLTEADRAAILRAFGQAAINKSSTTWRTLDESERAADPSDLLKAYPTLMKRPVIEVDGRLYLGWKADVQAALLG